MQIFRSVGRGIVQFFIAFSPPPIVSNRTRTELTKRNAATPLEDIRGMLLLGMFFLLAVTIFVSRFVDTTGQIMLLILLLTTTIPLVGIEFKRLFGLLK